MKKLLCVIMVVAMIAALATSAFAATIESSNGSDTGDVNAKYIKEDRVDVYKVEITWGAMEFDYNATGRKWNTETHTWDEDPSAPAEWTAHSDNTIKLYNHSSAEVNATFSFEAIEGYSLTGKFTQNSAELTGALKLEIPQANTPAKEYVVSFMPVGELSDTHSEDTYAKIGTITVQLG